MGIDLVVSTGVMDVALSRLVMRPIAGLPLLHIEKPQYRSAKRFEKRAFDFCFALAALIGTLPILLITSIAIKISSRGPVFYSSERIGIDGNPFAMLKFRTMIADADKRLESLLTANESDGFLFKIRNDPRVTPVGRLLRRFSIDELPQFINVLRREMSVVGPRPPLRREVEGYDCEVLRRMLVKPGITGLWQVSGRSDLSWNEAVRLDLSYVDNWSMIGDILIIAKTVGAVLQRKGAYEMPCGVRASDRRVIVLARSLNLFFQLRRYCESCYSSGWAGHWISEESLTRPKPMVEIGGRPILWHIMKTYSAAGITDFIVLLGYKGYMIKEYFANYFLHSSDVTIDLANDSIKTLQSNTEPWSVTLLDTGLETMTGWPPIAGEGSHRKRHFLFHIR